MVTTMTATVTTTTSTTTTTYLYNGQVHHMVHTVCSKSS
jgi:hypothetical protein